LGKGRRRRMKHGKVSVGREERVAKNAKELRRSEGGLGGSLLGRYDVKAGMDSLGRESKVEKGLNRLLRKYRLN
jgi:hypothetical protein